MVTAAPNPAMSGAMAQTVTKRSENHYPGGKGRSYRHIINLMPPHALYVETHLGGGAIMRRKRPAERSIGIDLDDRVLERWRRKALPGITVVRGDAVDVLPGLRLSEADLVYSDPPYVRSSRRTHRIYRHDYRDEDHERLLSTLMALPCRVIVSGYANDLYTSWLGSWFRTDYPALTHNGIVTESAWTNFEPGPVLHDYAYVGGTFREREQVRRRVRNLARRIAGLRDVEINAALARLASSHPQAVLAAAGRIAS